MPGGDRRGIRPRRFQVGDLCHGFGLDPMGRAGGRAARCLGPAVAVAGLTLGRGKIHRQGMAGHFRGAAGVHRGHGGSAGHVVELDVNLEDAHFQQIPSTDLGALDGGPVDLHSVGALEVVDEPLVAIPTDGRVAAGRPSSRAARPHCRHYARSGSPVPRGAGLFPRHRWRNVAAAWSILGWTPESRPMCLGLTLWAPTRESMGLHDAHSNAPEPFWIRSPEEVERSLTPDRHVPAAWSCSAGRRGPSIARCPVG